jgi:hypothetical protein
MGMSFFKIERRSILPEDWGDYGDILQNGMTAPSDLGIAVLRTGPYIPPITMPFGGIVLTSEAKKLVELSGLTGFTFLPVEKRLVVEVPWETWDLNDEMPPELPESGEPEDYIHGQPHSPIAAAALGELWQLSVPGTAKILRPRPIVRSHMELQFDLNSWNGADLIGSSDVGYTLFTDRAQNWFSERWGEYVQFDPFPTT